MRGRWLGLPWWWWSAAISVLLVGVGRVSLTETELLIAILVGIIALIRAAFAFVHDGAQIVHWLRHRGLPTDTELATAPNLRWHTPACVQQSSTTFEVRLQCSISGADVQGADAIITSTEMNDVMDTVSYNKVGTYRIGEFTFRIQGVNKTIAQVTRRVTWRVIYFDTHGRFGYVTDCWADVTFNGNAFALDADHLDLSGPGERHKNYRRLPNAERQNYEAMFKG